VTVAGRALEGQLQVEGDPRASFSDSDRRVRQTVLLSLYDLQRAMASARAAAREADHLACSAPS